MVNSSTFSSLGRKGTAVDCSKKFVGSFCLVDNGFAVDLFQSKLLSDAGFLVPVFCK